MGLIWFALAAMIGLVVGWVLRSAAASRQVARGRKQVRKELASEMDDLRERVTTLGRSAEERDRLQVELESLKELHLASKGFFLKFLNLLQCGTDLKRCRVPLLNILLLQVCLF